METPSQSDRKLGTVASVMALVSFLGFVDAAYLSAEHFLGGTPVCAILKGCDIVTTSAYATIGPIPVAFLGVLYYLVIFLGCVSYLDRRNPHVLRRVSLLPIAGFGFTLYLLALMAFVITSASTVWAVRQRRRSCSRSLSLCLFIRVILAQRRSSHCAGRMRRVTIVT
ncbi:vitamin K epoxide reductase family protein [Candidatus Uhrbacteria bacterium]|nr:vitamin K epoxide reductase family protein [Candidatus Uhrbacteria bacterium]